MSEAAGGTQTKSDFAYALVRDRILTHEYGPGTTLNQASLARELGISTTPLREALRRLASEALVELDAYRDARVTDLSAEEARDLLELRRALDPLAASLAAERRGSADIHQMRAALAGMAPLPDRPDVAQLVAHRTFHRAIYAASHNELLIATLDGLWDKADRYRLVGLQVSRSRAERDAKGDEHRDLLECVVSGDTVGAAEVMLQHIRGSLGAKAASRLELAGTAAQQST
ncbi:GntR family transcriptional regulator [Parafrigoribacterium mesophilum]|uniref:GntR family transcriptional regulator n=1 Tax=Parafrigoribacterium mesophilum TaxID=433646 RepID=UPI0031FDE915